MRGRSGLLLGMMAGAVMAGVAAEASTRPGVNDAYPSPEPEKEPLAPDPEPEGSTAPPDRLSIERGSPWFRPRSLTRRIDVYLDGVRRPYDVEEYCMSAGWLRTTAGRLLRGTVLAVWRAATEPSARTPSGPPADRRPAAAEKQARRAARNLRNSGGGS